MINYKQCDKKITCDTIICLDTEVSSAWLHSSGLIITCNDFCQLDKSTQKEYMPISLLYIWQVGIDDTVYYGRTLQELYEFISDITHNFNTECTIWVHNLAYEFQFLLNIIKFDNVFARAPHKVLKAERGKVIFRCSYNLTRLSLDNWGKQVGVKKLVGNLDYNVIRTPNTILTDDELQYCENDILVMFAGIASYRDKYETIEKIPLTQTGEIRERVKALFKGDIKYNQKIAKLLPSDEMYEILQLCFTGGYTHANYINAGKVISNVHSFDIASSYPFALISERYPATKFIEVSPKYFDKFFNDRNEYGEFNYSMLIKVELSHVTAKSYNTYISISHCEYYDRQSCSMDNGRIIDCEKIVMWCTNLDFDIIINAYDCSYNILECYQSKNEYLDKRLIEFILELFYNKTTLKNVAGYEGLYMQSKQFINSIYGMMVSRIVYDMIVFNQDDATWSKTAADFYSKISKLETTQLTNCYVAYQWGVFVTAYARYALWAAIFEIDDDVVYCDTDSVKFANNHDNVFVNLNKKRIEKAQRALKYHGLDVDKLHAVSKDGTEYTIGIFEQEKTYKKFKTLGAKRYAYTYENDNDVHITVSGVNKEKGAKQLKSINDFSDGLVFTYENTGKLCLRYLNDIPKVVWNKGLYDEYTSDCVFGINATPATYELSLAQSYKELLTIAIYGIL